LIVGGIATEVVLSWAILYWPPIQRVLGTETVPMFVYGLAWICVPLVFAIDYLQKRIFARPIVESNVPHVRINTE
jgi:sodium/potassium-transporting ATPase subunit alpha